MGLTVLEENTLRSIMKLEQKIPEVTLRDLFAMNAMTMFSKGTHFLDGEYNEIASKSYSLADAMLNARNEIISRRE